jgi:hypothetical protein
MTTISSKTRQKIKGYLEGFIQGLIDEYKNREIIKPTSAAEYLSRTSSNGELKPFQAALIPPELIRINQFERGLSTRLGNSFEECARLIALDHHKEVHRGYDLNVLVSAASLAEIEKQQQSYESAIKTKIQKPSLEKMIEAVLKAQKKTDLVSKTVRVDLHILTQDDQQLFFEIKAPKPNKGQCLEVLQRLLRFHLLSNATRPQIQAYYSMPYNPYGFNKSDYKWTQAKTYLPFNEAVVIGQDFWAMIGSDTTYTELLDIYLEVGNEKSKYMLDALALNF